MRLAASADLDFEEERLRAAPRLKFGLDGESRLRCCAAPDHASPVHRRVHVSAGRSLGYLAQWRAFCERQQRDWRDAHSDYDEDDLAGAQLA